MKTKRKITVSFVIVVMGLSTTGVLSAHCDTLDGPVAIEAQAALEQGDLTPLLKWVSKSDEDQIKSVFESVQKVRTQGEEAKMIADRYFLETLIRIHRASEGAPYTGLKPAGAVEPAIAAADKAITEGSADRLAARLGAAVQQAVKKRFTKLINAQAHKDDSVEAGREYVAAYVEYIHFVEGLHTMITGETSAHEHAADAVQHDE